MVGFPVASGTLAVPFPNPSDLSLVKVKRIRKGGPCMRRPLLALFSQVQVNLVLAPWEAVLIAPQKFNLHMFTPKSLRVVVSLGM